MKASIDEVCSEIIKIDKPLLFIDTCTILDIVRVLYRDEIPNSNTDSALKIIELSQQGELQLIIADKVEEEFSKHIDATINSVEKEISNLNKRVVSIAQFQESISKMQLNISDLNSLKCHNEAGSVAKKLLEECLTIKRNDTYIVNARKRVEAGQAPAKRGKAEQSDCEIIECFFDMCLKLRHKNFMERITFITSNTSDFGSIGKPHSPLDSEFQEADANFTTGLGHALYLNGYKFSDS